MTSRVSKVGPYELVSVLGEGGSAVVHRARPSSGGVDVALKVFRKLEGSQSASAYPRFLREAKAASSLDHPNIVKVLAVDEDPAQPWIAMELLGGGSLRDRLHTGGALAPDAALALVAKLARAIDHAHARGFLHRDLKPENVLFDEKGEPKLVDFGITKEIEGATPLTRSGTLVGTPDYLSPEQARGEVLADVRTDVWGLGVLLYELLSGTTPWKGKNLLEVLDAIGGPSKPLPLLTPSGQSTGAAGEVALHALEKDRERRPPSALAFALECERARGGDAARAIGRMLGALRSRWLLGAGFVATALLAYSIGTIERGGAPTVAPSPVFRPASPAPIRSPAPSSSASADLVLALPLRGSLAATVPANAVAAIASGCTFVATAPGKPLHLEQTSRLEFLVHRTFVDEGTVAAWVCPAWEKNTLGVETVDASILRTARVHLYIIQRRALLVSLPSADLKIPRVSEWTLDDEWRPRTWRHVAASWSQSSSRRRIFIDGRVVVEDADRWEAFGSEPSLERVGVGTLTFQKQHGVQGYDGFVGELCDFRLYSRELAESEVAALARVP